MNKNINKFYCEEHLIDSFYYKKDTQNSLLIASDIHYHPNVDKELIRLLIKYCQETKPDYIIMPGDQIETIDFIDITKEKDFFENMIKEMAEIAPVIIIPGNHEIGTFNLKTFRKEHTQNIKSINYFESLNKFKNVYFLNNEQTKIKDLMFLGFNPSLATYLKNNKKTEEMFIEDFIKSGLKQAEDDYNILLTHSPIPFTRNNIKKELDTSIEMTDLIITGHLHDGYLPKKLDKYLKNSNAGLFLTPFTLPFPGILCRGVHNFGRGYIFVSQGYRKWTADIKLFNAFEKFTANDVEKLILTNKYLEQESKSIHKTK